MKYRSIILLFLALLSILVFSWLTRVYRLGLPENMVFDERYHVPAVRLIAEKDSRAFEWWHGPIYGNSRHDWLHPPLAKYLQAGFFILFGGTAFSWRIGSAVFGVIGIGLVFIVAQLAFGRKNLSVLAAFLLALDGLWLVQSRVAMNDVFVSVLLLAAAAVYLWYRRQKQDSWLAAVGLLAGLGIATKWSAVFWTGGLLVWEVLQQLAERQQKKIPWVFFSLAAVPLAVYALTFLPVLMQGKSTQYIVQLHQQIIRYEFTQNGTHPDQSVPWQWFMNLKPVQYWQGKDGGMVFAFNNPLLIWLEAGAVVFALKKLSGRVRKNDQNLGIITLLFAVSFLPWIVSPRQLFYYHYTPAVPFAALLLSYWLTEIYLQRKEKYLQAALLLLLAVLVWVFWIYYPYWTGLPVPPEYDRAVFLPFALR